MLWTLHTIRGVRVKENDIRVGYEDGQVRIGLDDVLRLMSFEDKRRLADTLACNDDVIKFVTQQIIEGWTELGSHGIVSSAESEPYHGLPWAIRQVAVRANEIAAREIAALARALHVEKIVHADTREKLRWHEDQERGRR